jgi:hypothetical protein
MGTQGHLKRFIVLTATDDVWPQVLAVVARHEEVVKMGEGRPVGTIGPSELPLTADILAFATAATATFSAGMAAAKFVEEIVKLKRILGSKLQVKEARTGRVLREKDIETIADEDTTL